MSVTLKWLIYESKLDNLRCMTCPDKLETPIASVNILDNPDVVKWIKRNELVLTTGYLLKDNPERQRKIIHDLYEAGCSAMGIKIKRFFKSIPAVMINEAEKVGLPLIEIPFFYSFSDISKAVYRGIYAAEMDDVQREQKLIADLSFLFFNKGTVFEMLYRISDFLGKPVLLLNKYMTAEEAVMTGQNSGLYSRGDAFKAEHSTEQMSELNYQTLYCRDKANAFLVMELPDEFGFLCILDETYTLSRYYRSVLQKAGVILTMAMERNRDLRTGNNSDPVSYLEQFMEFLTKISGISQEQIIHLCDVTGFDHKKKRICIAFSLKNVNDEKEKTKIIESVKSCVMRKNSSGSYSGIKIHLYFNNSSICIFLLADSNYQNPELKKITYDFAGELKDIIEQDTTFDISAGISRCHTHIDGIRGAYMEALSAIQLNQSLEHKKRIASYSRQINYHLLSRCTQDELKDLYMDNIESIERYDKEHNTELLITLKTYVMNCLNASETAKKLFIHRNTLSHRLEKLRELLGVSLDDMEEIFALYLEMCAADLLE